MRVIEAGPLVFKVIGLLLVRDSFWLFVDGVFLAYEYSEDVEDSDKDADVDSFVHNNV